MVRFNAELYSGRYDHPCWGPRHAPSSPYNPSFENRCFLWRSVSFDRYPHFELDQLRFSPDFVIAQYLSSELQHHISQTYHFDNYNPGSIDVLTPQENEQGEKTIFQWDRRCCSEKSAYDSQINCRLFPYFIRRPVIQYRFSEHGRICL